MNRRALFGAAASVAVAVPAGAVGLADAVSARAPSAEPDPIYAALAEQRKRWEYHGECIGVTDEADMTYGFNSSQSKAAEAIQIVAGDADFEGRFSVLSVVPTTLAGMFAYLSYVESREGFGEMDIDADTTASLVATVRRFLISTGGAGKA
jgi:hypothetical protein